MQYGFYNLLSSSIGHILLTKPQNKLVAINIHYMLGRRELITNRSIYTSLLNYTMSREILVGVQEKIVN